MHDSCSEIHGRPADWYKTRFDDLWFSFENAESGNGAMIEFIRTLLEIAHERNPEIKLLIQPPIDRMQRILTLKVAEEVREVDQLPGRNLQGYYDPIKATIEALNELVPMFKELVG